MPDFQEYVQPTFTADRGWLHLETRYNYENLKTGSVWLGYNFSGGEKLEWEFTPMLGGVFGDTTGVAPGYKFSLTYWKLEFSSEGEWVFDLDGSEESFFYNWCELSIAPVEWFRFGLVGQRTQGLPDRRRHPARASPRFHLQENRFHLLRVQSRPGQADVGSRDRREFLRPRLIT